MKKQRKSKNNGKAGISNKEARTAKRDRKKIRAMLYEQGFDSFPIFHCQGKSINPKCLQQVEIPAKKALGPRHVYTQLKKAGWGKLGKAGSAVEVILCTNCLKLWYKKKKEQLEKNRKEEGEKQTGGKLLQFGSKPDLDAMAESHRAKKAQLAKDFETALEDWNGHLLSCPSCSKASTKPIEELAGLCAVASAMQKEQSSLKRMLKRDE